jgi:glycolate oxidase FAD binding subunit
LSALEVLAAEVGDTDPIVPVGGRTQWDVGGRPDPVGREVRAPAAIVSHEPEEMIVRCLAGTTVAELDAALAERGQMSPLDPVDAVTATVGGVLAVGRSGIRRLRWGPIRDLVLEVRFVSAEGRIIKAGAPVVKNVTGFDLCRLLVGSLGTLGVLGEVVLRVVPRPQVSRWYAGDDEPFATRDRLYRPSSLLWDGERTWVLLEGYEVDVDAQAARLGAGFAEVGGAPSLPSGGRRSVPPAALRTLRPGVGLAEIGVGVLHTHEAVEAPAGNASAINRRVKQAFDPTGRLNPGRAA